MAKAPRGRILVVEDDLDLGETLAAILQDEGYVVARASNGEEGLSRLREDSRFDLILLDLVMPVMDGWEFRKRQMADAALASIPVMAMSARGRHAEARSLPMDAYLEKPVRLEVLLAEVQRCACRHALPGERGAR